MCCGSGGSPASPDGRMRDARVADGRERGGQRARVRVLRLLEHRVAPGPPRRSARVHDREVLARREHRQVVGDEQHREVAFALQPLQEVEHLRLHHHVERGRRLVGDEHGRIARQRHRDHHPLPLAAGELVRVVVGAPRRAARPARAARRPACCVAAPRLRRVQVDRLGDLLSDPAAPDRGCAARPGTRPRARSSAPRAGGRAPSRTRPRPRAAPARRPGCPAGASAAPRWRSSSSRIPTRRPDRAFPPVCRSSETPRTTGHVAGPRSRYVTSRSRTSRSGSIAHAVSPASSRGRGSLRARARTS